MEYTVDELAIKNMKLEIKKKKKRKCVQMYHGAS